jgi:hypothetical protein
MSVSTEVQRTLVKSPPELWSELSNPEALARHLAELGEIRITAVEPETKVEWESDEASGVVQLRQSGWGTKVTLSVTRTPAIPAQPPAPESTIAAEPESIATVEPQPASIVEPQPVAVEAESVPGAVEPEPKPVAAKPEPDPEPVTMSESIAPIEPDPEPAPAEPQLGFFARLFRKRKAKPVAVPELEPSMTSKLNVEPEPEPAFEPLAAPELIYVTQPKPAVADLAAELASVETQMAEETTEFLTGVLDRLGAAHHRPFSRG